MIDLFFTFTYSILQTTLQLFYLLRFLASLNCFRPWPSAISATLQKFTLLRRLYVVLFVCMVYIR